MSRPKIRERFVAVKSAEQSAAQMLLGTRDGLLHRRTQLSNTIRGHAAEFGLVTPKGLAHIQPLLERIAADQTVPALAKELFASLGQEFTELGPRIAQLDKKLKAFQRSNELCRRLVEVPTIGPVIASSMVVKISNPAAFRSGRRCAAWLGLTPKDHSTAGKMRHGGITRAGDEGLRAALVSHDERPALRPRPGRGPRGARRCATWRLRAEPLAPSTLCGPWCQRHDRHIRTSA
jgi:transposase